MKVENQLKIVAGAGTVEEAVAYLKAGADEVFIGFMPESWALGADRGPINRREVFCCNVQIGSWTDLEILKRNADPEHVTIAFNSLAYTEKEIILLSELIEKCLKIGFSNFIIADYPLLLYLYAKGLTQHMKIHISGEFGEMNHVLLRELQNYGINRVIFHRKITINEMAAMIKKSGEVLEYEAFFLNENCHFSGGLCNSLHADELAPLCRVPYQLIGKKDEHIPLQETKNFSETLGASGCGFCALYALKQAGVTHLKIVGRGADSDNMIRDIQAVKKALTILNEASSEEEYRKRVKKLLFKNDCSGNCYYFSSKAVNEGRG